MDPTRPSVCRPAAALDLTVLAEVLVDDPPEVPCVVAVGPGPGLTLVPCGPEGPLHDLLGWTAPPQWSAVGVAAPVTVGRQGRRRSRSFAVLVDRTGGTAVALGPGGGLAGPSCPPPSGPFASVEGRLVDVCRRALDLPTDPAVGRPATWWSQRWLDRLVERLAAGDVLDWPTAAGLHPLRSLDPAADPATLARHPVARLTWGQLRRLAARRHPPGGSVEASLAGWMDDGMFARWITGQLPPLDELAAAVGELAPPPLAARVVAALRVWT